MTSLTQHRKIYRHPNNQGTVVEYDSFGTLKHLFVPDAKYRCYRKTFDLEPKYHGLYKVNVTNKWFSDLVGTDYFDSTTPFEVVLDDTWIQKNYPDLKNDGSAKFNTDTLIKFKTTEAAHYCRSIEIPEIGQCDLPNLHELMVIYLESDNIDKLDPTINDNPDKALGFRNIVGRFDFDNLVRVWSSSEFSDKCNWTVHYNGAAFNKWHQNSFGGVVPVKELD